MTSTRIGLRGKGRGRLFAVVVSAALVGGVIGPAVVLAANTTLANFEIDGNLPASTTNGTTEDWVNSTNTGADSPSAALKCTSLPCPTASNANGLVSTVVDGSGLGTGELFRDGLKVDPDPTTFTQGDKENDFAAGSVTCPVSGACTSDTPYHIVSGSTPPNKDDLFDVATNTYIVGNQAELDLGMIRTNNNGSSHVDFELNKSNWTPGGSGGVPCATNTTGITGFQCPKRTEGDLLISFEISPSSTTPPVSVNARYFVWDLPGGIDAGAGKRPTSTLGCDGPLTGNENTCPWEEIAAPSTTVLVTSVNGADMPAGPWGSRLPSGAATSIIPAGGWFEAGLDLDALGFPPSCPGFGTASAKARSSGSSVTSALTDLAGPFPINLNTCGKIIVKKVTVPSPDTTDSTFSYTASYDASGFSLKNGGSNDSGPLSPGTYSVSENTPLPLGFTLTSATCDDGSPVSAIALGNNETVTCTFTNTLQQGAIKISKTAKNHSLGTGDHPQAGVHFTIDSTEVVTGVDGTACLGSLSFGNHTVTETVPTGYQVDSTNPQTINVQSNGTCGGGNETAATFHNTPLTTITVSTTSLAGAGVTESTVQCTGEASTSTTPHTTGSLVPGTYTCTVIIDP
jgi:hypothetical protein